MAILNDELGSAVKAYKKLVDADAAVTARQDAAGVISLVGTNIPSLVDLESALTEAKGILQTESDKLAGFDYNGTMISYTVNDRNTVTNADVAFEKAIGGTLLIPDGASVNLTFDNGNTLTINKADFNATFLPAFYAAASAGLVV